MATQNAVRKKTSIEDLFGIPTAEFIGRYWGRTYCHAATSVDDWRQTWGFGEWRAATELGYNWKPSSHTLQGLMPVRNATIGRHQSKSMLLQPGQIDTALELGASIIGDALDPRLSTLAARLKDDLSVPGPVSTYASLSPAGEGAAPHYDSAHTFVLQMEGRKLWRLSRRPAVENPSRGRILSRNGEVDTCDRLEDEMIEEISLDDLETIVLETGDILYIPPGTAHATEALEQSLSVMINFAPPRFDALVELIVRRTLCREARWRGLPAAGPDRGHADYVNEGLERVREILAGLDASSVEVRCAWDEMTANMGAMQNSFAASVAPKGPISIQPEHRLAVTNRYPIRSVERLDADGELLFTVFLGETQVAEGGAGAEFLKGVLDQTEFTAGEARYWSEEPYDWDVVQAYIESLVRQGLLILV